MKEDLKIAMLQCKAGSDVAKNIAKIENAAQTASVNHCALLVCPEMMVSGYAIGSKAARRHAEKFDGLYAKQIAEIAVKNNISIVFGYPELGEDNNVYNATQLIDNTGKILLNYRKTNLFGNLDRSMFSMSDGSMPTTVLNGWNIGMLICYDIEFPENVRMMATKGVELLIVPTACMKPYDLIATKLVPTRAMENQIFVIYTNYTGFESDLEYCGLSCAVSPNGEDICRGSSNDESLLFAILKHSKINRVRTDNNYHSDRRPDLYHGLTKST